MAINRVTTRAMSDIALRGLQGSLGRTQQLQQEMSSGRRVNRPADDPTAAAASMELRSARRADNQYLRNIDDSTGRLGTADDALVSLSERVRHARGLIISANNGSVTSEGRAAISAELSAVRKDVVDLYNTRWLDRPVFGGTVAGNAAMDADGTYIGNDADVTARISRDATLRIDVRGGDAGADELPGVLEEAALSVSSTSSTDLGPLDAVLAKVLKTLGDVGARAARLDTTRTRLQTESLDFTSRISENEDIDLPETIIKLQSQQVAYQAALQTTAKILQVSLVDFLR